MTILLVKLISLVPRPHSKMFCMGLGTRLQSDNVHSQAAPAFQLDCLLLILLFLTQQSQFGILVNKCVTSSTIMNHLRS